MKTLTHTLVLGAASLVSLTWSAAVHAADEVVAVSTPPPAEAAAPAAATPAVAPNPLGIKPLDSRSLAAKRGGSVTINDMKLKGVVADNSATNVVTGGNVISDGALAGSAGLPTVIQNSGNNVLIQNATIVNVQLK
ncbi:hypothetical protein [Rhizobacter sp. Root1221]|uniref:hypothetical protein n=1 Tax=Rhizobacter sp. Root1221 TaxID=1736433 RepID=UPI0006F9DF2E|nr:hypothetical protein [Rhizobacter sp. Root1221]KQV90146.1 hypothetical protein ASC87_28385 [Rhizobacter sp. Root1221]